MPPLLSIQVGGVFQAQQRVHPPVIHCKVLARQLIPMSSIFFNQRLLYKAHVPLGRQTQPQIIIFTNGKILPKQTPDKANPCESQPWRAHAT